MQSQWGATPSPSVLSASLRQLCEWLCQAWQVFRPKEFPTHSCPFHSTPQKLSRFFFSRQPILALNHRLPYLVIESFHVGIVCLLRGPGSSKGRNCSCSRSPLFPTSLSTRLKYKVATHVPLWILWWRWNLTNMVSETAKAISPQVRLHSVS